MNDKVERDIAANPDKYDFQDVPADRPIVPENEAAYQAAWAAQRKLPDQPTSEMLWIEHEGLIYRGYSPYYPLFIWHSLSKSWIKCNGKSKKEGWGGEISEVEACGYMF